MWAFLLSQFDAFQFFWMPKALALILITAMVFQEIYMANRKWVWIGFGMIGLFIFKQGFSEHLNFQRNAHPAIQTEFFEGLKKRLESDSIVCYGLLYQQKTKSISDHPFALRYFGQEPIMVNSNYYGLPLSILSDSNLLQMKPLKRFLMQNPIILAYEESIKSGNRLTENQIIENVIFNKKMPFVFCENRKSMIPELRKWVSDSLENPSNQNIVYFFKPF